MRITESRHHNRKNKLHKQRRRRVHKQRGIVIVLRAVDRFSVAIQQAAKGLQRFAQALQTNPVRVYKTQSVGTSAGLIIQPATLDNLVVDDIDSYNTFRERLCRDAAISLCVPKMYFDRNVTIQQPIENNLQ